MKYRWKNSNGFFIEAYEYKKNFNYPLDFYLYILKYKKYLDEGEFYLLRFCYPSRIIVRMNKKDFEDEYEISEIGD